MDDGAKLECLPHELVAAMDAVAAAWASIDGKLEQYEAGRDADSVEDEPGGYYSGYLAEAHELIKRIERRGFTVVRREATQ